MRESKQKLNRKQRMLRDNPICCFCGGGAQSTSEDHILPRACFPAGYHPEGMELPACDNCNQTTRPYDDIFGFYAMAVDFDEENLDTETFNRRIQGLLNNYPDALPIENLSANQKRRKLKSMGMQRPAGQFLKDVGIVSVPQASKIAVYVAIRKLACALYYMEAGRILSPAHRITGIWQQAQDAQRAPIANYWNDLLPEYRQLTRSNIRNYGRRFCYKFGFVEEDDFFAFIVQIGSCLMLSGMTISPEKGLEPPMAMPIWRVDDPWDCMDRDFTLLQPQQPIGPAASGR